MSRTQMITMKEVKKLFSQFSDEDVCWTEDGRLWFRCENQESDCCGVEQSFSELARLNWGWDYD